MRTKLLFSLAFFAFTAPLFAQVSQLNPGDIAIIAFQSDNNDQFAFLSLVDIAPNTQIQFSEKGWNGSLATPAFVNTTEGVHTWTAASDGLAKGTVVVVNFNSLGTGPTSDHGTVTSSSAAKLSTSGDELIAFQGSPSNPNFIYAFGSRPWIVTGTPTSNQSWLPSPLANGLTARDFPTENDDQHYNIAVFAGTKDQILASIGNTKNWIRSNARFTSLPDWKFQLWRVFYLQSSGDLTKLTSWGSLPNGTGNQPDSFLGAGKIFYATNRVGKVELSDNWRLEKLQIDQNLILSLNGFQLNLDELIDTSLGVIRGSEDSKLIIRGKSGTLKFDTIAAFLNRLELSAGATVTLNHPLTILCNANKGILLLGDSSICNSNGNLVIGSTEKGSSMIQNIGSGGMIKGKLEVQKFIPAGKRNYRFMGHPFANPLPLNQLLSDIDITGAGGSTNGFTNTSTNNPSAFWYNSLLGDGSSNDPGWIAFSQTNGADNNTWNPNQGIRINIRGKKGEGLDGKPYTPSAVTIHPKDSIIIGNKSLSLTKNAINDGFNLIGNPFAADIDMSKLQIGSNINSNYYLWDPYLGTMGGYTCFPYSTANIIPSYGAFFAQTSHQNIGNTIVFTEACTVNTNNALKVLGVNDLIKNQLTLSIESDSIVWDKHTIIFNEQYTDSADRNDAKKMMNPELNLYSLSSEKKKLSIDARSFSSDLKIPLDVQTELACKLSLKVNRMPELVGYDLYLIDKYANNKVLLKEGLKYEFIKMLPVSNREETRFEIQSIIKLRNSVNSTDQKLGFIVFPNPSSNGISLQIHSPKLLPLHLKISTISGQQIFSETLAPLTDFTHRISLSSKAAGSYVISISNAEETVIQKIIKY